MSAEDTLGDSRQHRRPFPWRLLLLLPILVTGCDKPDGNLIGTAEPPFIEAGDLPEITARGQLRVLYPRRNVTPSLPRKGHSLDFEIDLVRSYAEQSGLEPLFIYVDSRKGLIPALLEGKGDLIAGNLTATEERRRQVDFTVPLTVVREQIVTRKSDTIERAEQLAGRKVALRRSSSYWASIQELRERHPGIELVEVPENLDTEEIVHRVAENDLDLTVADSNLVAAILEYRDDVRPAFDLPHERAIAWAIRPGSTELRRSLNRFLTRSQLSQRESRPYRDDLAEIKERRVIRVLTRNSAATYFLWRGELMGFEYELTRAFAARHGLRVEMIVPRNGENLLDLLRDGSGDIVAAALTPTQERIDHGVRFSQPYNFVSQVVVARSYETELNDVEALAGRTFHVRRNSSYWQTLRELQKDGVPLVIKIAPEEEETEDIIAKVASSEYDLTLADSNILGIELTWQDDIIGAFPIGQSVAQSWAVRESSPELLEATNEFIKKEYRGLFYNVVYERYFRDPDGIRTLVEHRYERTRGLSPYDDLVRKYAGQYDFDWRLIVSQMYQESRFDPRARSFAGAQGLMQVLPRTAAELGFNDVEDPESGIHAGLTYMDWVRDRFEPDLPVTDRMWFTLAGYNAGPGHVRDARRLATQQGLNPNRWFDNVEKSMLLLSRRQYAQDAPHGYCRCREPVEYVRQIRERYNAYVDRLGDRYF